MIKIEEKLKEDGRLADFERAVELKDLQSIYSIVEDLIDNSEPVKSVVLDLVMLTPDAIAKHLEWNSYHHMMINEEHIDHQLKEAINMLFFTNKLEVPFG